MRFLVASTLALGLGASCVNQDGSVFIEGAVPIPGDCTVAAGAKEFLSNGVLDVSSPRSYTAALQVVTNLPATFSNTNVTEDKTKSPNYPNYGATDNNVIIFDSAETSFSFAANPDIVAPDAFACDDTSCATNEKAPSVNALAGTVFNTQTQLNGKTIVFAEAISSTLSTDLAAAFDGVLKFPTDRVRVVADIVLKGTTTGNGDLRPVTTFSFPLPIDVCVGCLAPNADFCAGLNAVSVAAAVNSCFEGQDVQTAACQCADGSFVTDAACP